MDAGLPLDDRFQGLAVFGESGTGKSVFLTNLILRDIRTGCGGCVIDYHGDLVRNIIAGLPPEREEDVILVDLTDGEFPIGLSLLELDGPPTIERVAATASFIGHLFEVLFGTGLGTTPRLLECLRALTRTLIEVSPDVASFTEIPLLFANPTAREKVVSRLTNPAVVLWWEAYNRLSDRGKQELVESTRNKITAFTDEPLVRHIIGQAKSTIDLGRVMQEDKILLVKLSPLYEEASKLVGGALLAKLLMAGFARARLPEERRRPFMLTVDEFQRVAAGSSDMKTFIHEARKFRVGTTLVTQTLQSLDEGTRAAALACGNLMVFRVSGLDAPILAKNFDATPTQEMVGEEPVRAPTPDPIGHLVRYGHTHPVVAAFVSEYLMALESLFRKAGSAPQAVVPLGGELLLVSHLVDGQRLLNEVLVACMRTGRADIPIPPLALLVLGGAADERSVGVFYHYIDAPNSNNWVLQEISAGAKELGAPNFLDEKRGSPREWLKKRATTSFWDRFNPDRVYGRIDAFLRMLRMLREVMGILAREPIMVNTGQYRPRLQQRTYSDMQGQRANELSQLPNFHARARFLSSGEYVLKTKPLPPLLSGDALEARIQRIKRRNWEEGYTVYYKAVEKSIQERQERLQRPNPEGRRPRGSAGDPPPTSA